MYDKLKMVKIMMSLQGFICATENEYYGAIQIILANSSTPLSSQSKVVL